MLHTIKINVYKIIYKNNQKNRFKIIMAKRQILVGNPHHFHNRLVYTVYSIIDGTNKEYNRGDET